MILVFLRVIPREFGIFRWETRVWERGDRFPHTCKTMSAVESVVE